ncbi:MAG: tetratricopeptide repeat protein [Leptolyngbyaceae cyanobacterium SM1_3_5]|nr:tetratricopeptide repeat protein [Leptolyngbyaceae cyanobacterium SM1_3_5]
MPTAGKAHQQLGNLYAQQQQWHEAAAAYAQAIRYQPDWEPITPGRCAASTAAVA